MLAIQENRKAVKYSKKELFRRVLWMPFSVIFRLSPRPCFGFRRWLLRCFGASVGTGVHIYPSAVIYFPWNFLIGEDSSVGEWALVYNLGIVTIGKQVTLSQRCHICAGTHDYTLPEMPLIKPPVDIQTGAWICADAYVGPSVTVGEYAIVAARAVVVKDVGAYSIVGGNPAKVIGSRTFSSS